MIFSFSLLAHYFVLNFFGVDYNQDIKAVVINSEVKGQGLFKRAEVVVKIDSFYMGKYVSQKKVFSTWDKIVNQLKPGSEYMIKTQSNWIVAYDQFN